MKSAFMAGCALSSYNPILVKKTAEYLRLFDKDMIVVQKCCGKPTKYMGNQGLFNQRFDGFLQDISDCSVDRIISACSGCQSIIKKMSKVEVVSLWEVFEKIGIPSEEIGKGKDFPFTVFDPCQARDNPEVHNSVRNIMEQLGYKTILSCYERENTLCCGFGGMVGVTNPEIATMNVKKNFESFETEHIAVYCATCRQAFGSNGGKAWHLLDLIWGEAVDENSVPPENVLSSPVNAWVNRYKSKRIVSKM